MPLTTVFFDLDGTLLPMDQEVFVQGYLNLLAETMHPHGYKSKPLVDLIWRGTFAMIRNNGTKRNEEVFWQEFSAAYGAQALADRPLFDAFYETEFQRAKDFCGTAAAAAEAVRQIRAMGLETVLATNPIFPRAATESRIRWAGLEPSDFAWITTYENASYCKPNPAYYTEILEKLHLRAEECLMVGNDVSEDMVAQQTGMQVFLLTDCLINRENADIARYPHGSFEQLMNHIRANRL